MNQNSNIQRKQLTLKSSISLDKISPLQPTKHLLQPQQHQKQPPMAQYPDWSVQEIFQGGNQYQEKLRVQASLLGHNEIKIGAKEVRKSPVKVTTIENIGYSTERGNGEYWRGGGSARKNGAGGGSRGVNGSIREPGSDQKSAGKQLFSKTGYYKVKTNSRSMDSRAFNSTIYSTPHGGRFGKNAQRV